MRVHRKRLTGAVGAVALTAGMVTIASTTASAAPSPGAAVVVNEVYGGGGNSGATLRQDFIELANVSSAAVNLTGWSVQYASSTGASWQVTPLDGTLPAGGTYVVREAQGSAGTEDVVGDATGTIAMSGTAGKVALVNTGTALASCAPTCSALPQVVDFVGFGSFGERLRGIGSDPGTEQHHLGVAQCDPRQHRRQRGRLHGGGPLAFALW